MLPSVKLSDFKQVKLLARVSSSGSAMPQPGDLLGVLETVETGTKEKQKIVINQEIK
jgi:cytochrome c-type biogenesis protein CcmH